MKTLREEGKEEGRKGTDTGNIREGEVGGKDG